MLQPDQEVIFFQSAIYSVFTSSSTSSPPVDNTMDTNIKQQIVSISISEHDTFQVLNSLNLLE